MTKIFRTMMPLGLICGLAAAAIPAGIPVLNWTQDALLEAARGATESGDLSGPAWRLLNGGARKAVAGLDEGARVALVREAAPRVKAVVMSAAFGEAHAAWLKQAHNAVDHGGAAKTARAGDVDEMQRQLAGQMYSTYSALPVEAIKMMLPEETAGHKENLKAAETAEERAKYKDLVRRAEEVARLLATDPGKSSH